MATNSYLFAIDTDSLYTDINTEHALEVIGIWLDSLNLPDNFHLEAVREAMSLVMTNDIFEWGDLYFLQLSGTTTGTSVACMWETLYFAVHEMGNSMHRHGKHLPLVLRFIDDMI